MFCTTVRPPHVSVPPCRRVGHARYSVLLYIILVVQIFQKGTWSALICLLRQTSIGQNNWLADRKYCAGQKVLALHNTHIDTHG